MKQVVSAKGLAGLALSAAFAFVSFGCSNVCDQAADYIASCSSTDTSTSGACDLAIDKCKANCILDASCEDITMPKQGSDYVKCLEACAATM